LPRERHAIRVNTTAPLQRLGCDSPSVAGEAWKWPAAQFGVQSFWWRVAVPAADAAAQVRQWIPVRYTLPSPHAITTEFGRTSATGCFTVNPRQP